MMNVPLRCFRDIRGLIARCALVILLLCPAKANAGKWMGGDDLGYRVEVDIPVRRVVSLVPTNSEMVCLLDCDRLKGGTRYDQFPRELPARIREGRIEIIGGGFDASLEKIVQLDPDLILANGPSQQKIAAPLRRMGYPVLSVWPRDFDGLKRDFLLLGEIVGRRRKTNEILAEVERGFVKIQGKTEGKKKKTVYLQMWSDPMITVGKESFPNWLLTAAGGLNVFEDLTLDSARVSLESLIQRNPEVLIFLSGQEDFVKRTVQRPEWRAIRAVQRSHICFVEETDIRRSIQFLEGLVKIQTCLFGGGPAGSSGFTVAR